jgi:hypothetical protein
VKILLKYLPDKMTTPSGSWLVPEIWVRGNKLEALEKQYFLFLPLNY